MKSKKITIKPFLNTKLKPEARESDGTPYFPLYYLISYNRQNTHLRSYYGEFYKSLDNNGVVIEIIDFESQILMQLIEFETQNEDDAFELKGLKPKFVIAAASIGHILSESNKKELMDTVRKSKDDLRSVLNFHEPKIRFEFLYQACALLYENFQTNISEDFKAKIEAYDLFNAIYPEQSGYHFPTIINWKYGTFRKEFEQKLTMKILDKKRREKVLQIIDSTIERYQPKN